MLIIHIGMPKTGTTSIQNIMHTNADLINNYFLIYPRQYCNSPFDFGHNTLAQKLINNPFGEDADEFIRFLNKKENKYNNVIISAEWFTNGLANDLKEKFFKLLQRLAIFTDVCIIIFVRRFDSFIDSSFKLEIKNGTIQTRDIIKYANERLVWFEQILKSLAELESSSFISSLRIIPYKKGTDSIKKITCELLLPPIATQSMIKIKDKNLTPGIKEMALYGFHIDRLSKEIPFFDIDSFLFNMSQENISIPGDIYNYSLLSSQDRVYLHNFAINASHSVFRKGYYDHFCYESPLDFEEIRYYDLSKDIISEDEILNFIDEYRTKFHPAKTIEFGEKN